MIFKNFAISFISFLVLDLIWLGFVMKDFNLRQLAGIGRIEGGKFDVLYAPAFLTYVLMAAGVSFFVLPKLTESDAWYTAFLWGAAMGLIVYGVFDLTNLAILKDYPLRFALADMAWGAFVFGAVTCIARTLA